MRLKLFCSTHVVVTGWIRNVLAGFNSTVSEILLAYCFAVVSVAALVALIARAGENCDCCDGDIYSFHNSKI